jgi:hypothetical protein
MPRHKHSHRLFVRDIPLSSRLAGVVAAVIAKVKKPVRPGWDMFRVPLSVDELQIFGAFMEAHGFRVKLPDDPIAGLQETDILAEVHCALVAGGPIVSDLAPHQDSFGGVRVRCRTMIVYFRHTAERGGLYYWTGVEDPTVSGQPPELLSTVPPEGCVRVVLLDGDTWHVPQPVEGYGERVSFVFQCEDDSDDVALAYAAVAGDSGPSARASELFGMPPLWSSVLEGCGGVTESLAALIPSQLAPFAIPSLSK